MIKSIYFSILIVTPFLFNRYVDRIFEGPKVIFLLIAGGALVVWAGVWIYRGRITGKALWRELAHPITFWFLLFYVSYFAACLYSIAPPLSIIGVYERQMGLITLTLFLFLYLLGLLFLRPRDLDKITLAVVLPAVLISFHSLLNVLHFYPLGFNRMYIAYHYRTFSTLGHPFYLGMYLSLAVPIAAAGALASSRWTGRVFYAGVLPLMIYIIAKTQSRAALIAVAVALFFGLFFFLKYLWRLGEKRFARKWGPVLIALFVIWIGAAAVVLQVPGMRDRLATVTKFSQTLRYHFFKGAWELIREAPVLGTGPETFRITFLPHKSLEMTRLEPNVNHDRAHNQYLHIWATQGLLGLIAYLGLLGAIFKTAFRVAGNATLPFSVRVFGLGITSWIIAYATVIFPGFDNQTTLLLFVVLAASTVILEKSRPQSLQPLKEFAPSSVSGNTRPWLLSLIPTASGIVFIVFGAGIWIAEYYYYQGRTSKDMDTQIRFYKKAARVMPYETLYDFQLSRAYYIRALGESEPGEKKPDLQRATAILANSLSYTWMPESYIQLLGAVFLNQKKYQKMESIMKKALRMDPYNQGIQSSLIASLIHQGKYLHGLELLRHWKNQFPDHPNYYFLAGILYENLRDFKRAEKEFLRAIGLDPRRKEYRQALKRVRRNRTGISKPEKAEVVIPQILEPRDLSSSKDSSDPLTAP